MTTTKIDLDFHQIRWLGLHERIETTHRFVEPPNLSRPTIAGEWGRTVGEKQPAPGLDDGQMVRLYGYAEVTPLPAPADPFMFVRWFNARGGLWMNGDRLPKGCMPVPYGMGPADSDVLIAYSNGRSSAQLGRDVDDELRGMSVWHPFGVRAGATACTGWLRFGPEGFVPPTIPSEFVRWLRARLPWEPSVAPGGWKWIYSGASVAHFSDVCVYGQSCRLAVPGIDDRVCLPGERWLRRVHEAVVVPPQKTDVYELSRKAHEDAWREPTKDKCFVPGSFFSLRDLHPPIDFGPTPITHPLDELDLLCADAESGEWKWGPGQQSIMQRPKDGTRLDDVELD